MSFIPFCNFRTADATVTKVAYVEFEDSTAAGVSLHLTSTVFVDRALMIVPVMDGEYWWKLLNSFPIHIPSLS